MSDAIKVRDYHEAFDLCRERDKPTLVYVELDDETSYVFPSGYSKLVKPSE